jgi:hypothetical protein
LGAALRPLRDARRREAVRAEKIGERRRRAVLGDQLLGIEVDRRRPDALAILRRPTHTLGKSRPRRPAADGAGVDEALMLGDFDQPLRKIEGLAPLHPDRHRRAQARAAMAAGAGFGLDDPIGLGDLTQGLAFVALLPAARPARPFAKAHWRARLPQTVARRRLRTCRTVQSEPAPEFGVLSPQGFQLPLKRGDQRSNVRRENHPLRESQTSKPRSPIAAPNPIFPPTVTFPTHPAGKLPFLFESAVTH